MLHWLAGPTRSPPKKMGEPAVHWLSPAHLERLVCGLPGWEGFGHQQTVVAVDTQA